MRCANDQDYRKNEIDHCSNSAKKRHKTVWGKLDKWLTEERGQLKQQEGSSVSYNSEEEE